ncbi:MAG: YcxB family protein [Fretibacterium sp.]|nr:YcxB family protein [Fretibacterium sp.]
MTLQVELDGRTFRRFALFDVFKREGRWRRPALFTCFMLALSCVCLMGGSVLLASVFCIIGLGLPGVWIGTFLVQVTSQARRLDATHAAYTVTLKEDGILGPGLENPLPWDQVHAVYCVKDCVYLYVTPLRAILIPSGADGFDEVGQFLAQKMPGRIKAPSSFGRDATSAETLPQGTSRQ